MGNPPEQLVSVQRQAEAERARIEQQRLEERRRADWQWSPGRAREQVRAFLRFELQQNGSGNPKRVACLRAALRAGVPGVFESEKQFNDWLEGLGL